MSRLVRDDRKATVTQITHSLQPRYAEYISERTTRRTLKQMALQRQKTTPGAAPVS